jgi:hypothetical protein
VGGEGELVSSVSCVDVGGCDGVRQNGREGGWRGVRGG